MNTLKVRCDKRVANAYKAMDLSDCERLGILPYMLL
jgi:hypothetical protein